jgi:DeoR/GlpR family transcriptional regulator of sugar metabolism
VSGQLERYVTPSEIAELMGVSERTVRRMRAAGMPSETWGLANTRRYLASQALALAHAQATIRIRPGTRPQTLPGKARSRR